MRQPATICQVIVIGNEKGPMSNRPYMMFENKQKIYVLLRQAIISLVSLAEIS